MNIKIPRETFDQMREALEIGYECAAEVARETHERYKGYKPARHAAVDEDAAKVLAALTAAKAVPMTEDDAMEQHATALARNLAQSDAESAVYATEYQGKPYAVSVETAEVFNAAKAVSDQKTVGTIAHIGSGNSTLTAALAPLLSKAVTSECSKVTSEYSEQPQAQGEV